MSHTAAKEAGRKTIVKYEICFIFKSEFNQKPTTEPQVDNIQLRTMNEFHDMNFLYIKFTTYRYYLG